MNILPTPKVDANHFPKYSSNKTEREFEEIFRKYLESVVDVETKAYQTFIRTWFDKYSFETKDISDFLKENIFRRLVSCNGLELEIEQIESRYYFAVRQDLLISPLGGFETLITNLKLIKVAFTLLSSNKKDHQIGEFLNKVSSAIQFIEENNTIEALKSIDFDLPAKKTVSRTSSKGLLPKRNHTIGFDFLFEKEGRQLQEVLKLVSDEAKLHQEFKNSLLRIKSLRESFNEKTFVNRKCTVIHSMSPELVIPKFDSSNLYRHLSIEDHQLVTINGKEHFQVVAVKTNHIVLSANKQLFIDPIPRTTVDYFHLQLEALGYKIDSKTIHELITEVQPSATKAMLKKHRELQSLHLLSFGTTQHMTSKLNSLLPDQKYKCSQSTEYFISLSKNTITHSMKFFFSKNSPALKQSITQPIVSLNDCTKPAIKRTNSFNKSLNPPEPTENKGITPQSKEPLIDLFKSKPSNWASTLQIAEFFANLEIDLSSFKDDILDPRFTFEVDRVRLNPIALREDLSNFSEYLEKIEKNTDKE